MTVVINKLFQPLTYQMVSGTGLHLPPRGRVEISEREVSEELRRAAQRGFIVLDASTAEASTGTKEG